MTSPGWWPDPTGRHEHRYHNGAAWTADVADDGARFVDPYGVAPGPVAAGTEVEPARRSGNTPATAALVLGIGAAALGLVPFVFVVAAVAAVVAIGLGIVGLRRAGHTGAGRSRAVTGLVTAGLGLLASIGGAILTVLVVDALDRYENAGAHELGAVTCERDGDAWRASGTITNRDDEPRSYTVTVEFRRAGTDNAAARTRVVLDDVAPGERRAIEARRVVDLDEVDCAVSDVDGPAPFGVDLDG